MPDDLSDELGGNLAQMAQCQSQNKDSKILYFPYPFFLSFFPYFVTIETNILWLLLLVVYYAMDGNLCYFSHDLTIIPAETAHRGCIYAVKLLRLFCHFKSKKAKVFFIGS